MTSGHCAHLAGARRQSGPRPDRPYLDAVEGLNPGGELRFYPGSRLIVQSLLRAEDRLIACELVPRAGAALTAALHGDRRCKALTVGGGRRRAPTFHHPSGGGSSWSISLLRR